MIAKDIISDRVPPIRSNEDGEKAIRWMQTLCVDHLPVVDNGKFLGLISMDEIIDLNKPKLDIGDYLPASHRSYVQPEVHIFEVIKLAVEYRLTLIPVVDQDEQYYGSITLGSLLNYFAKITSLNDPGGILTFEMNIMDYSMTEIARIVESNDARILTSYISTDKGSGKLEVTLKINLLDLSNIIATFERYDYKIKATFQESEYYTDLKERFESLMKYLNI